MRTLFLMASLAAAAVVSVSAQQTKPHVLLLGDSISMGYHQAVVDEFKDVATVVRPQGNCEGTTKGVANIDEWLAIDGGRWDVIHFNFGLHDLKHVDPVSRANSTKASDPPQATPAQYEQNLRAIVATLKTTGAKLIFATTTPFPSGTRPYRDPQDAVLYNEIALKVMKENDIPVDDLYGFALPKLGTIQQPANVHFSKEGSEVLGKEVAKQIRAALGPS